MSEFDMYIDLFLLNKYEKYIENKAKEYSNDFNEDDFGLDKNYTLDDIKSGKVNHIHIGGYTDEEIEEFWNDDSIYGKKIES